MREVAPIDGSQEGRPSQTQEADSSYLENRITHISQLSNSEGHAAAKGLVGREDARSARGHVDSVVPLLDESIYPEEERRTNVSQPSSSRWQMALRGMAMSVGEAFSRVGSSASELLRDVELRRCDSWRKNG